MHEKTLTVYDIAAFQHFGNDADFYANDFRSQLKENEDLVELAHRHNFYMIVLFTAGNGYHEIEFNRYNIKPGYLFMLGQGQVHTWELSDDVDGYIFFHTK